MHIKTAVGKGRPVEKQPCLGENARCEAGSDVLEINNRVRERGTSIKKHDPRSNQIEGQHLAIEEQGALRLGKIRGTRGVHQRKGESQGKNHFEYPQRATGPPRKQEALRGAGPSEKYRHPNKASLSMRGVGNTGKKALESQEQT